MFSLKQIKRAGKSYRPKSKLPTVEELEEMRQEKELENISFEEYQKMMLEQEQAERPIRQVKDIW